MTSMHDAVVVTIHWPWPWPGLGDMLVALALALALNVLALALTLYSVALLTSLLPIVLPRSMIGYCHHTVVCLSVCLSVMKCIAAKRYILQKKVSEQVNRKCPVGTRFTTFNSLYTDHIPQIPTPKISKCNLFVISLFSDHVTTLFKLLRTWESAVIEPRGDHKLMRRTPYDRLSQQQQVSF